MYNIKEKIELALTLLSENKLKESAELHSQLLISLPKDPHINNNLGIIYYKLNRLDESVFFFNKALLLKEDFFQARFNLANVFFKQGRLNDSISSYKIAIMLNCDSEAVYSALGAAQLKLLLFNDALDSYKNALSINPNSSETHNNIGHTLYNLRRLDEAKNYYNKAIKLNSRSSEPYYNLGVLFEEYGKYSEAEACYRKAIEISPNFINSIYNLGILLQVNKKFDDAAKLFKQIDFKKSNSYLLKCFYYKDKKNLFFSHLENLLEREDSDALIGSLIINSEIKFGVSQKNPFCNNPYKYILERNLIESCDFKNIFINNVNSFLNNNHINYINQGLLKNGTQTAGNIFDINNPELDEIKKIINIEIQNYLVHFKNSTEGFIKKWPKKYTINGWLVSMKTGGELSPHMHENGWISGSVYINVPKDLKFDQGKLVLSLSDDKKNKNKMILNINTGSICLFPSSLIHYTIPFTSSDKRIVLAFDVIPDEN